MRKKVSGRTLRRPMGFLLGRMLRYPGLMLLTLLTLAVTTAATLAIPYFAKLIINDCILKGDIPGLLRLLAVMAAVYLLSTLSTYGTSRILVRVAQRVSHDLRAELFDRMQTLPMSVFHSHTHGQLMSTYTNDIDTISNFISSSLANAVTSVLGFAGILVMLLVMNPLRGQIAFEHMDFSYVPGTPVLRDISFVAEPGKKIALVGSTGAGKSTIVNLLNRFYEIDGGAITYDSIDLKDIRKDALRSTLSIVPASSAALTQISLRWDPARARKDSQYPPCSA